MVHNSSTGYAMVWPEFPHYVRGTQMWNVSKLPIKCSVEIIQFDTQKVPVSPYVQWIWFLSFLLGCFKICCTSVHDILKAKAAKAAVEAERQRQEQSSVLEQWN